MRRTYRHVFGFALSGVVSLLLACEGGAPTSSAPPKPVASVSTAVIATGQVEETLETLGRVEFDPKRTRTVAFVASGQVRQVLVTPGQGVAQGTELLALGPLPGDSLEVQQATIDLEYARRELERLKRMRDNRLATNEQVQLAEKAVSSAEAVLAGMGAADPGEHDRNARAPFAGIVREVLVTSGAIVHAGEPAVLLAPAEGVVVRAGFEPENLGELETGLAATIVPVLDSDGEVQVQATLAEMHRIVDPETQLVEAVLHTSSAPAWMLPGTTVRVRVVVRSAAEAVLVPRAALLARDGTRGVFVVDGGTAHWTPLELGIEGRDVVEARRGVTAGARVVTTGRSVLSDGMAIAETASGSTS
jgi:RND family efflux transporter MFP subunit